MAVKEEEVHSKDDQQQFQDETDKPSTTKTIKTKPPPDIFLSYCWANSHLAYEEKRIERIHGNEYSDPRLLKEKLEGAGYEVWLDVERLESANADQQSMYGQIVQVWEAQYYYNINQLLRAIPEDTNPNVIQIARA